jgi:hypothetical protein
VAEADVREEPLARLALHLRDGDAELRGERGGVDQGGAGGGRGGGRRDRGHSGKVASLEGGGSVFMPAEKFMFTFTRERAVEAA